VKFTPRDGDGIYTCLDTNVPEVPSNFKIGFCEKGIAKTLSMLAHGRQLGEERERERERLRSTGSVQCRTYVINLCSSIIMSKRQDAFGRRR
jgi:hypothetical protein